MDRGFGGVRSATVSTARAPRERPCVARLVPALRERGRKATLAENHVARRSTRPAASMPQAPQRRDAKHRAAHGDRTNSSFQPMRRRVAIPTVAAFAKRVDTRSADSFPGDALPLPIPTPVHDGRIAIGPNAALRRHRGVGASQRPHGRNCAASRHHGITASRIVRAPSAYLRLPVGFFSPLRHASAVAGRCRPSPKRPLPKSDPQRSRSRREGQARRLSARAALGPSFGIRMGSGADRVDPQRLRPRRVRDGGQPRRRVRRADRRVASRAGDRRGADHRATDCPADGEFSGGGRGLARVADRRRQPEPLRSRRSRQRADRRDCRRHRPRAAAGDARAVGDESGGAAVVPSVAGAGRTPPRCHPGITPTSSVRCLHRSRCT
ncbi:hypothetical protein BTM_3725 [Burkholderia thailandensis 34]|nr:hypothetical protein BTM_3725 [Burkholderia thailandensis 34]